MIVGPIDQPPAVRPSDFSLNGRMNPTPARGKPSFRGCRGGECLNKIGVIRG